ncbi:MAG: hypothetical protein D6676_05575 [Cyanobacteria bacterium J003]|jgi:hypothetical protein|nr:MAG: hypothetical protein D6676_05575 [Cyanobacteria bacterium J003]
MNETTSRVKDKGFTTEQRCTRGGYANAAIAKAIITNGHRFFSMGWYGLQSVFMQKYAKLKGKPVAMCKAPIAY